jgi:hypothetical protein
MSTRTSRKTPPAPLENFYNVGEAAVRMNFKTQAEHEAGSSKGERWLRDGANRPEDGSKGKPFPHFRMNGNLMFSDSNLAEIAAMHRNAPTQGARRRTRRAPRKQAPTPIGRTATEAELEPAA